MARRHFISTEELAIDALYEKELQANKDGEYDTLYNKIDTNIKADKKIEEESSSDGEDDSSSDNTDVDESVPTDETPAQEAFANLTFDKVALEDWSEVGTTIKTKLMDTLSYLSHLGITYGPDILRNVYKGVIYIISTTARMLFTSMVSLRKYIDRRVNSFNKLKENIKVLKDIIKTIESKTEQTDLTDIKYNNKHIINSLKIKNNVDLNKNIELMSSFVKDGIVYLDKEILNDIASIKYLIANLTSNIHKDPINSMKTRLSNNLLVKTNLDGYKPTSEFVETYISKYSLPGDTIFIYQCPKEELNNLDEFTEAYNNSSMFLGLNLNEFKEIANIDYMSLADLKTFLDKLNKLCDICMVHKAFYESILKQKSNLRYSFKLYFNAIINSKDKLSVSDSLTQYVYLKSMFIDKVYLKGAMDIHDYAIKVISNSLSYAKDNLKKLS